MRGSSEIASFLAITMDAAVIARNEAILCCPSFPIVVSKKYRIFVLIIFKNSQFSILNSHDGFYITENAHWHTGF